MKEIINEKQQTLVSICCLVYNHEPYLRECFDGFMMQKTNFDFEVLVHDDASSDNSASIIREYETKYPDIFKPIYQTENQYSKGVKVSATFNFPRATGKYIAMCEGDDYWTDPLKLQKQVDFLESHPDYGMCYTNFDIYFQTKNEYKRNLFFNEECKFKMRYSSPEEFIIELGYVCPPSWVYRKECLPTNMLPSMDGTFVLFTHFLCTTKVYAFEDVTAVYRILEESASHSNNYEKRYKYRKNLLETQIALIKEYHLSEEIIHTCYYKYYREGLANFIIHNKTEDIRESRKYIKFKDIRGKIMLLFASCSSLRLLFKNLFLIYKKIM